MIKHVTGIKYMPPWKPDPAYQRYQRENYLTDSEIQLIADWVDQGAVQGNPADEDALPVYPNGSQIGTPDMVLSFSQKYNHVGNNTDEYRYFVIPTGLTEDKDLIALEVRPGNKKIVHHTLIWEDTTGQAAAADAATPEYGYAGSNGTSVLTQVQLPGYVPGSKPSIYSNQIAQRLHAGADLKLQMHYAPSASDEEDSTTVNLFFAEQPATRFMNTHIMVPLGSTLINGPFLIAPNTVKEFHGTFTVPIDVSLYGIAPHMHKLGTHWKVYAVLPAGDTIPLISIKEWDFNWQGLYQFKHLIHLTPGSVIHALAEYDNTTNNPLNPNSPPTWVTWGEKTSDEMYYLPIAYLPYQQGDENIEFTDPVLTGTPTIPGMKNTLYPVSPNPTSDQLKIGYSLSTTGKINLRLYNELGELVQTIADNTSHLPGLHTTTLAVSNLPSGIYMLVLEKDAERQVQKVVVIK
jgi:hypothetical protein